MKIELTKVDICVLSWALEIASKKFEEDILQSEKGSHMYNGAICASIVCDKMLSDFRDYCKGGCVWNEKE